MAEVCLSLASRKLKILILKNDFYILLFWQVVPMGMYKLLTWIRNEYDNPPVIVTENGVSDFGGTNDLERVNYFNQYLDSVLNAIEDGCNIKGYIAWSLMDSYEWKDGFSVKFGLYHVDYTHPNRTRTPKMSAKVFSQIVKTHVIDWDYKPKPDIIITAEAQVAESSSAYHQTQSAAVQLVLSIISSIIFVQLA